MSDPAPWPGGPLRWPEQPLFDGVVWLSAMTEADVGAVAAACNDLRVARWLPVPVPYGETEAREFLDTTRLQAAQGRLLNFAIRPAADGPMQGSIGVHMQPVAGIAELGYWVAPDAQGRGLATRALRLVARHAFATLGLRRIAIRVQPDNVASWRVAERAGAVFEGVARHGIEHRGMPRDARVYSLLPGDVEGPAPARLPRWPPAPLAVPHPPLTDGAVTLDELRRADADAVAAVSNDAVSARWLRLPSPYTADDARSWMATLSTQRLSGVRLGLAIRREGQLAGTVGLSFQGRRGEATFGYSVGAAHRGQGLAGRATVLLARHAFATWPLHRIELLVEPGNHASVRVAEKVGAVYEGLRRAGLKFYNRPDAPPRDVLVYALTPDDLSA